MQKGITSGTKLMTLFTQCSPHLKKELSKEVEWLYIAFRDRFPSELLGNKSYAKRFQLHLGKLSQTLEKIMRKSSRTSPKAKDTMRKKTAIATSSKWVSSTHYA